MRQVLICTILLCITVSLFSQQINAGRQLSRAEYLQKSKRQNTAAHVLALGGAIAGLGGAVWQFNEFLEESPGDEVCIIGLATVVQYSSFYCRKAE